MLNEIQSEDSWIQTSFETYASVVKKLMNATIDANSEGAFREVLHMHFQTQGKMLRPYLAFRLGLILQTPMSHSTAWATTCELLHNATLIHDDLQDRDVLRRGQPTLWHRFGDAQAINAGDFLMMSSLQPTLICSANAEVKNKLIMQFSKMSCKIAGGQSIELELNKMNGPESVFQQYMNCVGLKTAALFSDLAVGINILSERSSFTNEEMDELFGKIGILFQMHDDIIDLYGNKQREGRGCDIKEGKISFLIATHLQQAPEDFGALKTILEKPREHTTEEDIQAVENILARKDTLHVCHKQVADLKTEILNLEVVRTNEELHSLVSEMIKMILLSQVTTQHECG